MKKITLLFITLLLSTGLKAQDLSISFESSEGFALGEINGQNSWVSNATYSPFVTITDAMSTDGTNSLHLQSDPFGPVPGNGITGTLSPGVLFDGVVTFTADLWIESGDGTTDSEFHLINQSPSQMVLTSRVIFFAGDILVLDTSTTDPTALEFKDAGTYTPDTWIELKIDYDFNAGTIDYFIDNTLVLSGDVYAGTNIEQLIFFSSFNQTEMFIDNVNLMNNTMSVDEVDSIGLSVFPNPTTDFINIRKNSDLIIDFASIYDVTGKIYEANVSSDNRINVDYLASGVYLLKIETENGSETIRFIKK